jgi:hypothetical protein
MPCARREYRSPSSGQVLLSAQVAYRLSWFEGLRNKVVVRDDLARRIFPEIQPADYRTAVQRALPKLDNASVETTWSDALSATPHKSPPVMLRTREDMIVEQRRLPVACCAYVLR